MLYPGHFLKEFYPSAEIAAPVDRAFQNLNLKPSKF